MNVPACGRAGIFQCPTPNVDRNARIHSDSHAPILHWKLGVACPLDLALPDRVRPDTYRDYSGGASGYAKAMQAGHRKPVRRRGHSMPDRRMM
jgi:hypothetical protein